MLRIVQKTEMPPHAQRGPGEKFVRAANGEGGARGAWSRSRPGVRRRSESKAECLTKSEAEEDSEFDAKEAD